MFQIEQQVIEEKIKSFCGGNGIPLTALEWKPIPFSGEWGISTSFFASAALEARSGKNPDLPVQKLARATVSHSDAEPVAKVVLGVLRDVDAVAPAVLALVVVLGALHGRPTLPKPAGRGQLYGKASSAGSIATSRFRSPNAMSVLLRLS